MRDWMHAAGERTADAGSVAGRGLRRTEMCSVLAAGGRLARAGAPGTWRIGLYWENSIPADSADRISVSFPHALQEHIAERNAKRIAEADRFVFDVG